MFDGRVVYIKIPNVGFSNTNETVNKPMTIAEALVANEKKNNIDSDLTHSKDTFVPQKALV